MPFFAYSLAPLFDGSVTTAKLADDSVTVAKIAQGTAGQVLQSNATPTTTWVTLSGDVTINSSGVTAIEADKIVNADVNTAAAIARSKLAAGTASHVLVNDGSGVMTSEASLAVSRGGTALSALGTALQVLRTNAGANAMEWGTVSATQDVVKMDSQTVTGITDTSEVELCTKTFSSSDFAAGDLMLIRIMWINATGGGNRLDLKLRIYDGTNTFTSSAFASGGDEGLYNFFVSQMPNATTQLYCQRAVTYQSGTPNTAYHTKEELATMIAAWITTGFTLSIRGNNSGASTSHFRYWVYKFKA